MGDKVSKVLKPAAGAASLVFPPAALLAGGLGADVPDPGPVPEQEPPEEMPDINELDKRRELARLTKERKAGMGGREGSIFTGKLGG